MPEPVLARANQGADLRLIEETWQALRPFLEVDKCVDCECLQAALTELVMGLEDLPATPGRESLFTLVRGAVDLSKLHTCLGCDPCEPADLLASFYRRRDAGEAAAHCGCGPSCANG